MQNPSLTDIAESRQNLTHPDSEIRLRAVKDLVSTQNLSLISELSELMKNEADAQVRYEMRKGLGILRQINKIDHEPDSTDFTDNLIRVEKAFKSSSEATVNKAFRYAIHYRLGQFIPLMEDVIKKTDSSYQKNLLIRFMLSMGGEAYFSKIIEFLSDADPRVISTAIEVLEVIGNTKALGYIGILVTHESNRVQATAMKALYNLGDQNALKLLQKMIHSPHRTYRDSAAYALKEMRLPQSLPLLEKLALDEDESIRQKALEGIGYLTGNQSLKRSNLALKVNQSSVVNDSKSLLNVDERTNWIREQVDCISRKEKDSEEFINDLLELLQIERNERIIAFSLSALGRIGCEIHVDILEPFLQSENHRIRANAVEAIGHLLSEGKREILLASLLDINNRVVGNAIMALCNDSPQKSQDAMLNLCQGNLNEQLTAVYCIGAIARDDFLGFCDYLLESPYGDVREKMLKVLEDLSHEMSSAVLILKQWKLRISAFEKESLSDAREVTKHQDEVSVSQHSIPIQSTKVMNNTRTLESTNNKARFRLKTSQTNSKKSTSSDTQLKSSEIWNSVHRLSAIILTIGLFFSFSLNTLNILISDRFEFYSLFLSPLRMLLIAEWLHNMVFILGPPAILMFFLYSNRDLILGRCLLGGLIVGIFLHQYVQLLDTLRLDVGPIVNFLAYHSSRFYLEENLGTFGWSMQIFNLPWLFLPVFIEGSLRFEGLLKMIHRIFTLILVIVILWLAQLNYYASDKINQRQSLNLILHLEYRREQLKVIINQNRLDKLVLLAGFNKASEKNIRLDFARKLNSLKLEERRYQSQMEYLDQKIKEHESQLKD